MQNKDIQMDYEELKIAYANLARQKSELEKSLKNHQTELGYFELLTRNTDQGFFLIDPDVRVIRSTKRAVELLALEGRPPLAMGEKLFPSLPDAMKEPFKESINQLFGGDEQKCEKEFIIHDAHSNKPKYYQLCLHSVIDQEDIQAVCVRIKDLTQEKTVILDLAKTNNLITSIFNSTTTGICVTDQDGIVVQANQSYCKIYGYEMNEVLNHHFTQVVLPEYRDYARQLHDDFIIHGEDDPGEWDVVKKSGEFISIFATKKLIVNPDGSRFMVTTVNDITQQKKNRDLLRTANSQMEAILESTEDLIWCVDSDLKLLHFNKSFSSLLNALDIIPEKGNLLSHPNLPDYLSEDWDELYSRALAGERFSTYVRGSDLHGKQVDFEFRFNPSYDESGQVLEVTIFGRDISERLINEAELLRSQVELEELNQRFRLANKAGKIGVWEYNFPHDMLIWGENTFQIFGVKPDDFEGKYQSWANLLHQDDKAQTEAYFMECVQSGKVFDTTFRIMRSDNEVRYIQGSGIVYQDEAGNPERVIGIKMDITEEYQNKEKIRLAKDLAEEMTRLKSNFLANMSHEIRTPLNGILGLLPMLKIENDPSILDEIIVMMERSGKRLLNTLIGILDLARIEAEQSDYTLVQLDVNLLLEEVFQALASMARAKHLAYSFKPAEEPCLVLADERMLTQIFTNMIGNALKFTSKGQVHVRTIIRQQDDRPFVAIEIVDTGIGISPENISNIFQPFKQESEGIRRQYEGSGLGLSIVKRYAELLEGSIEVRSEKGMGSTFTILLPKYIKEPQQLAHS